MSGLGTCRMLFDVTDIFHPFAVTLLNQLKYILGLADHASQPLSVFRCVVEVKYCVALMSTFLLQYYDVDIPSPPPLFEPLIKQDLEYPLICVGVREL